jgi:4-azaleucine resistance transporter AzlC
VTTSGQPAPREVRRASVTLAVAVGVFGISFGVVATGAGLSVPMACAMSLLVFTGATQFAVIGVLAAGGSALAAIGSGLLLGARHIAYGLSLSRRMPPGIWKRLLAAQFLLDESTAMATAQDDPADAQRAFWWTGLSVFVFWNLGTLVGALFGNSLGDPGALGLDAVFPAAFLALLAPLLRRPDGRAAAIAGSVIGLALVPFAPAGVPIVAAAAGVVAGLFFVDADTSPPPPEELV